MLAKKQRNNTILPIYLASSTLTSEARNYNQFEKETLAVL